MSTNSDTLYNIATSVSVVLPVFNEDGILEELTRQLNEVLEQTGHPFEIIFINDGSTDGTRPLLDTLAAEDTRIQVVHLSRNFGHQSAIHAGLQYARGAAVIVMDSDLQDNPTAIPRFLEKWEAGYEVVYAQRVNRKESAFRKLLFFGFYRVLNALAESRMPADAGNFSLLDRRVVDILLELPEVDRYFPGLRSWVGFRQTGIPVERDARYDSRARVSLVGLFRLAKTALLSFSAFPLTLFYVIAGLSAVICVICTTFVVYHKLFTGLAIPGWASMMVTASFFGALNALGISVLGEYVIRIYKQVRRRPLHIGDIVRVPVRPSGRQSGDKNGSDAESQLLELLGQVDAALRQQSAVPRSQTENQLRVR